MSRSKKDISVFIHYPATSDEIIDLRKHIGLIYKKFIKTYIKSMKIDEQEKIKMYSEIIDRLMEKRDI